VLIIYLYYKNIPNSDTLAIDFEGLLYCGSSISIAFSFNFLKLLLELTSSFERLIFLFFLELFSCSEISEVIVATFNLDCASKSDATYSNK